jgi:hypothetical protein
MKDKIHNEVFGMFKRHSGYWPTPSRIISIPKKDMPKGVSPKPDTTQGKLSPTKEHRLNREPQSKH